MLKPKVAKFGKASKTKISVPPPLLDKVLPEIVELGDCL